MSKPSQGSAPAIPPTVDCEPHQGGEPAASQTLDTIGLDGRADTKETGPVPAQATGPTTPVPGLRFRVLRPLGEGGLGLVQVALDEELKREVALKEIQARHHATGESLARFLLEAEVTGQLEHPGVVPIYSLGRYEDGRPYYAMRLINGETFQDTITRFHAAEKPGRDPGERSLAFRGLLRSFIDACNAVAYAHNKGVLHRDLKPANVMLGAFGETLVIDWGLAKVQGKSLSDSAEQIPTPQGMRSQTMLQTGLAGTPPFMSPEQADARHNELGPASDVYSLGAILYVLLTGRMAFGGNSVNQVLEQVRQGQFPPPRQINATVPPALEAVCLKAMALRPKDRYATAKSLAEDVEHWLGDEPVAAHCEPFRDRVRRWGRRHRTLVVSLAALLMSATAALSIGLGLVNAANARLRQEEEKTRTALEAEKEAKRQVTDQKRQVTDQRQLALQTVQGVVTDIDAGLKNVPDLQALRKKLLGKAQEGLQKVARAADNVNTIDHEAIQVHFELGDIFLTIDGGVEEAKKQYDKAFDLAKQVADANPKNAEALRDLALAHGKLGDVHIQLGNTQAALEAYQAGLRIFQPLADAGAADIQAQRDLAGSHINLGDVQKLLGNTQAALDAYQASLRIRQRLADTDAKNALAQRELSVSHERLGDVRRQLGNSKAALEAYQASLRIRQHLADADPKNAQAQRDLSVAQNKLGDVQKQLGNSKAALEAYQASLRIFQHLADADPKNAQAQHDLSVSHDRLGDVHMGLGHTPAALEAFQASLKIRQRLADADPKNALAQHDLSVSQEKLGDVQKQLGNGKAALEACQATLQIRQRLADADPKNAEAQRDLSVAREKLGSLQLALGNMPAALEAFQACLKIRQHLADADPKNALAQRDLLVGLFKLGDVAQQSGEFAEAIGLFSKALDIPKHFNKPEFFAQEVRVLEEQLVLCRTCAAVLDNLNSVEKVAASQRADVLIAVINSHVRRKQPERAVAAADRLAEGAATANPFYDAACGYARCIPLADKPEVKEHYAVRAMELLKQAVAKDYKDAAHMKMDSDLDTLRERGDFKALLRELEGKKPEAKK